MVCIMSSLQQQGESEEELPEYILGSARFSNVDWSLAENLESHLIESASAPPELRATAITTEGNNLFVTARTGPF